MDHMTHTPLTDLPSMSGAIPMSPLGRTGPIVSRLALGTMTFGAESDQEDAVEQLDAFVEAIDAIDVYFVHGWDQHTPVIETLDTLAGLIRAGKIHSIGWSNVTGWQLAQILTEARHGGLISPCVVQPQYNLLDRGIELEVLPCCLDYGISITPWSPLGGGWLTGKYSRNERPTGVSRLGDDPNRGVEAYDVRNTALTWTILDAVRDVAQRHDRPMGQVAIAWLMSRAGGRFGVAWSAYRRPAS